MYKQIQLDSINSNMKYMYKATGEIGAEDIYVLTGVYGSGNCKHMSMLIKIIARKSSTEYFRWCSIVTMVLAIRKCNM